MISNFKVGRLTTDIVGLIDQSGQDAWLVMNSNKFGCILHEEELHINPKLPEKVPVQPQQTKPIVPDKSDK